MIEIVEQHRAELLALCRRYDVRRLDLFGSGTRSDFDPLLSDLDFLVEFNQLTTKDAADRYLGLLIDLEDLFSRKVDLVSASAVRNPYFQKVLDQTRVSLYAA